MVAWWASFMGHKGKACNCKLIWRRCRRREGGGRKRKTKKKAKKK